jgi:hypothetical protein
MWQIRCVSAILMRAFAFSALFVQNMQYLLRGYHCPSYQGRFLYRSSLHSHGSQRGRWMYHWLFEVIWFINFWGTVPACFMWSDQLRLQYHTTPMGSRKENHISWQSPFRTILRLIIMTLVFGIAILLAIWSIKGWFLAGHWHRQHPPHSKEILQNCPSWNLPMVHVLSPPTD